MPLKYVSNYLGSSIPLPEQKVHMIGRPPHVGHVTWPEPEHSPQFTFPLPLHLPQ
jgi:hypothetical protein